MRTMLPTRNALVSALCGGALLLSATGVVYAQAALTSYSDVQAGAWYEGAAVDLLSSGALDPGERQLRPTDFATRAELVKLLVRVQKVPLLYPRTSSFNDVALNAWYSPYFESAGQKGWIRGDGNCFSEFRPCYGRPASNVNRAEAATLLLRTFNLEHTGFAPDFTDNTDNRAWYQLAIQTAADHCILQGDDVTGRVRPAAFMNRAEMIVMFDRAMKNLSYGTDCGDTAGLPYINGASADSQTSITLNFSANVVESVAEAASHYTVTQRSNGARIGVKQAVLVDGNSVRLTLQASMSSHTAYTVAANNISTQGGAVFSDTVTIVSPQIVTENPNIVSVETLTQSRVLVRFDTNLDETRAEDESRYQVSDDAGRLVIDRATLRDERTVELELGEDMQLQSEYALSVNGLLTANGTLFADTRTFLYDNDTISFSATLKGLNIVPLVVTTGSGSGTFELDANGLHYDIGVSRLSGSVIAGEFRRGPAGSNGPLLKTISFSGSHASGVWSSINSDDRRSLLEEHVYLIIRTTTYPNGEVRGQVERK